MATKAQVDTQHDKVIQLLQDVKRVTRMSNIITEFQINNQGQFFFNEHPLTGQTLTLAEQDTAFLRINTILANIKSGI